MTEEGEKRILCVGLACLDIVTVCEDYPLEDTDQKSVDYYWQRGGNASNTASVLALMGANVELMASFVRDEEYKFLERDLREYGIKTDNCVIHESGFKTPNAIILINAKNGSRTILANLKGHRDIQKEDFDRVDLGKYSWIHFECRPNCEDVGAMMERVKRHNQTVSSDQRIKVSVELEKTNRPKSVLLWDKADYVFVSKEYAVEQGYSSKEDAVSGFISRVQPGGSVICAWGEDGAAGKAWNEGPVYTPIFRPDVVKDTLAAGDTFNAATIFALNKKKSLQEAIKLGCCVAGAKCGMRGRNGLKEFCSQLNL